MLVVVRYRKSYHHNLFNVDSRLGSGECWNPLHLINGLVTAVLCSDVGQADLSVFFIHLFILLQNE